LSVLLAIHIFSDRIVDYFYYTTTIAREKRLLLKSLNILFKKGHLVVFTTMLASVSVAIQRMKYGSFLILRKCFMTMPCYSIRIHKATRLRTIRFINRSVNRSFNLSTAK